MGDGGVRRYTALGAVLGLAVVCAGVVLDPPGLYRSWVTTPLFAGTVAVAVLLAVDAGAGGRGFVGALGATVPPLVAFGLVEFVIAFTPEMATPLPERTAVAVAIGALAGAVLGLAGFLVGAGGRWVAGRLG